MPSSPSRAPLTQRIIQELESVGFPVGDNTSPLAPYGWSGEPDGSNQTFTPWMTCTPLAARQQRIPGAMGDTGTEWVFTYTIFFAGVTRRQSEALADRIRNALTNITRERLEGTETGTWKIQKITCTTIGGSAKVGSAYPDYFTQADTFEVWVTKGKS